MKLLVAALLWLEGRIESLGLEQVLTEFGLSFSHGQFNTLLKVSL